VLVIAGGAWLAAWGLLRAAAAVSPALAWAAEIMLLYVCLSTRDLAVESWPVYRALQRGDLRDARRKVSMIVGRDTDRLEEPEVVRAGVETIGESTLDGIVAPLFYAVIGGAPLAWAYKAVNTLDSMVGFRSVRYIRFGRAAATVDRALNRIPAWLTVLFLAFAGQLLWRSGGRSLKAVARLGSSENSYVAEAAIAGALGVRLGGVNLYQGKPTETPWMGEAMRPLGRERIAEAIRVMYVASALAAVCALGAQWLLT